MDVIASGPPFSERRIGWPNLKRKKLESMQSPWIDSKDLQEARFQKDAAARERWERTALARAVAIAVIRYRAEHRLSQRALGKQLGMPQPHVARLELG